ncbi:MULTISPECIES: DUF2357 domain-containing protein [unclassified Burkholderia]|uniref:DUF2357 domain-containing protein n=1 Tax=unclassified Burkholderia TaxID=2613784 RepID=UPI000F58EDAE|nr:MULTISPECIES: DUF2357 domain-containing protein [unclassified Burkholderia]RQR43229.1 DUF2357 domain-containing protein [Burkholderia sp. Bp9131]RQR73075.1 DUF2357 domain-containing protein [Burkholderia sp. Bp9015]
MLAVSEAIAPLRDSTGNITAKLHVAVLPRRSGAPRATLWSLDGAGTENGSAGTVELLEGTEYRYTWEIIGPGDSPLFADPEEVFQPDTVYGTSGRLRPGLSTGTIRVVLRTDISTLGQLELEVRSRKLSYLSEYRWMLRDIAERMTELVMDRFAVSDASFELDDTRDAVTLYQRFTFLRALFESENFQGALHEITRRPHTAWETTNEMVRAGAGIRADSHVLRQFAKGGSRSAWPDGALKSVPSYFELAQTEATHDTVPNRFVKFALEHWLRILGDIDRGLSKIQATPATTRGRREISVVTSQLEEVLHHDVFTDVGRLTRFPADNQVLQKREGYRDIFKAYVETEFAARLSWQSSPDVYGAGQRDVATLYEYWAFVQLSQVVANLVGHSFDLSPLVQTRSDGLTVGIRTGVETVLAGEVNRLERRMRVELCFNRTYRRGSAGIASWTRPMRPDYSLLISPADDEQSPFEPIVLHFDAKYRIDFVREIFGADNEEENAVGSESPTRLQRGGPLRDDLLKMHAYRDAIHRTAGAYVLYPGGDDEGDGLRYPEYHELLPGLGAFVLRPTDTGIASGTSALQRFISDVLDHVATRLTRHERGRYWLSEAYDTSLRGRSTQALTSPSPEASVLLGFVKSPEHWSWIQERRSYNVRAEGRRGGVHAGAALLSSQLLLLYCPSTQEVALTRIVSGAEKISEAGMSESGYPVPRGNYWCVQIQWLAHDQWLQSLSPHSIDTYVKNLGLEYGEPISVRWSEILSLAGGT